MKFDLSFYDVIETFPSLVRFIFTKIQKIAELTPRKISGFSFEILFIESRNKYKHLRFDWGISFVLRLKSLSLTKFLKLIPFYLWSIKSFSKVSKF